MGTECGECRKHGECSIGFKGISNKILGNLLILAFREIIKKILGNVPEDPRECYQRFRKMFGKILRNVQANPRECLRRFQGTKISIYFLKSYLFFINFCC